MIKIKFSPLCKVAFNFIRKNRKVLTYCAGALGLMVLSKYVDLPISVDIRADTGEPVIRPVALSQPICRTNESQTPKEVAIKAIMDKGLRSVYDEGRVKAAKSIMDIVCNSRYETDLKTISTAISALDKLAGRTVYSSNKNLITDIITELAKEG